MKLDPAAVWDDLDDVSREERPGPAAPPAQCSTVAAVEVAAEAHEREAVAELLRLAVPELDRRVAADDPCSVRGVEVDRTRRTRAPTSTIVV